MDTEYTSSDLSVVNISDIDPDSGWVEVQKKASFLTGWGIETLRDGLDGLVRTVLIKPHYICKDYRDLYSNFYSKKFLPRETHCNRLHFFKQADLTVGEILTDPEGCEPDYIGYSVIRPIAERCIGRTMIDPNMIDQPFQIYCLRTPTNVHINGIKLSTSAYPYSSQSREPTVCAHTVVDTCLKDIQRMERFIPTT